MRIAEIIGTVTLSACIPEFEGATLRLARPRTTGGLSGETVSDMEPLVVYDQLGADYGSQIALSEGSEAAQPFRPELKPVDAYNGAIIDAIDFSGMS